MTRSEEIADMWYRDRSGMGADALAAIIARETGCNKKCVKQAEEVDMAYLSQETLSVLQTLVDMIQGSTKTNFPFLNPPVRLCEQEWVERANRLIGELRTKKENRREMKFLMMNRSYQWVFIGRYLYEHPPDNMIANKACVDSDGLVSISVFNIAQCDLDQLVDKLRTGTHVRDKLSIPSLYEAAIEAIEHVAQANWDNRMGKVEAAKAWLGQVVNGTTDQSLDDFQTEDDFGR